MKVLGLVLGLLLTASSALSELPSSAVFVERSLITCSFTEVVEQMWVDLVSKRTWQRIFTPDGLLIAQLEVDSRNKFVKAEVLGANGKVEVFTTLEALMAAFPDPCAVLKLHEDRQES